MREVGLALGRANVAAIYLAHGTFAGSDASGILGEVDRWLPRLGATLRQTMKQAIDALAGDAGNYTAEYARTFEESINRGAADALPVRLFHWSSENCHIGRANAAVRMIDELQSWRLPPGKRILLWGHSHAGNVFALMTNLLSGDREKIEAFFDAAEPYYRWPLFHKIDLPVWKRVREKLLEGATGGVSPEAAARTADTAVAPGGNAVAPVVDIVTFGTPLRYGWDLAGCGRLLHVVYHRAAATCPEYRAPFPPNLPDVLAAVDGDYVQQFGIAGTNIMPSVLTWRSCWADWRLNRLLQPGLRARELLSRLRCGCRVPDAGTTLLVDYGPLPGHVAQHLAGHAVYTRLEWLAYHAKLTVRWLYGDGETTTGGDYCRE